MTAAVSGRKDRAAGFLRLFTVVHAGETPTVLLLSLNIFLLFTAYYIIKPVREALIIAGKGAEIKSYLSAASAVLLIFVVKLFSRLSSRFPRQKLIGWITGFFISNLILFFLLSLTGIPLGTMGILFFVWVGIFNVMVVAQFWGFANDLYTEEAGKRLFPLVAFGATFGAFFGSRIAGWLVAPLGLFKMMLVAAGLLGICILLTLVVHRREIRNARRSDAGSPAAPRSAAEGEAPLAAGGGFQLLFRKKYLLYVAFFVLLLNFINTNGEYFLGHVAERASIQTAAADPGSGLEPEDFIGRFYAGFFMYANLLAMMIQLFFVSRIFRWIGVRGAIFFLPLIALGGYALIAAGASLLLVKWVKVVENGTDYSLMNTTRHALFLVTAREDKYKAKAAVDTFFHRAGDVLSALLVFLGTAVFALAIEKLALVNVALVGIWAFIGILIFREHRRLSGAAR